MIVSARPRSLLLLIFAAFILMGAYYSATTLIFESPDEPQHFFFVREIVEQHGLPVQVEHSEGRWSQEGSQPPLYYLVGALATFWTDASDWRAFSETNPYAVQGDPLALGNRNLYIHSAREDFPWRGTALSVHVLRGLSLILGALSLFCTYQAARVLFPTQPIVALGAVTIQALIPQFLFISAAVSNDALAACVGAATLWQAARVARGAHRMRNDMALGVLVGLAALTKLSGAAFALVAVVAVVIGAWSFVHPRVAFVRRVLRAGMVVALTAFVVAGWWYARNLLLYGDVTGLTRMLAIVGQHEQPLSLWDVLADTEGLRLSFWGVFGWFSILLPNLYYNVYDTLTLAALIGLSVMALRALALRSARVVSPPWLLPLSFLIVLLGVLRWGSITPGLAGRLLFPALSAIAILLSAGLNALLPLQVQRGVWLAIAGVMSVLALLVPAVVIAPAYVRPVVSAADGSAPLVRFGDQITLIGVSAPTLAVHPNDEILLTFKWTSAQPLTKNYTLWVKLFGENDELLAAIDTYPGFGMLPTTQWQPNRAIVDVYRLRVSPLAYAPTYAKLSVGFYQRSTLAALAPTTSEGRRIVRPIVARIKVLPTVAPSFSPTHPLDANFGDQISLRGYDWSPTGITLYWQSIHQPAEDYTVFVHALDRDGKLIAQSDGQPHAGDYPTSVWERGEWVRDTHAFALPPQTARIEIGLYVLQTGARLPLVPSGDPSFVIEPAP